MAFPQALRLLHAALDETAGHVLFVHGLESFLLQHEQFQPLEPRLRNFFQTSARYFFAGQTPLEIDLLDLQKLFEACRLAERKLL
jgi:hypothetical protein